MSKSQVIETKRILHTPSDFAKSTLFYVQEAGRLRSLKSHVSRREHLDSFLFLIVLSGEGAVTYRDRRYHLKAGGCMFIDCKPVSYTHLDVYKRQPWMSPGAAALLPAKPPYIPGPPGNPDRWSPSCCDPRPRRSIRRNGCLLSPGYRV